MIPVESGNTLSSTEANAGRSVAWGRLWGRGALAILAAAVINELFRIAAVAALDVPASFLPLTGPGAAAVSTFVGLFLGLVVLSVVLKTARAWRPVYLGIATVALLLSLVPNVMLVVNPEEIPGTTPLYSVLLGVQHLIAFGIGVPAFLRAADRSITAR